MMVRDIRRLLSTSLVVLTLHMNEGIAAPTPSQASYTSAALTTTSTASESALKYLQGIILQNVGNSFSMTQGFQNLRAIQLKQPEAAKVAEIILDVKRSLVTFRERNWLMNEINQTDTRRMVPGQYAHFYLNFYEQLLDVTQQNILGAYELKEASDLPIKIAIIEQAIYALETTLQRKPDGSSPGGLYGWWSSSAGFNDYALIEKKRVDALRLDLWKRYNELIYAYNQNPPSGAQPLPYAPISGSTYTPSYAPTANAPSMAMVPYANTSYPNQATVSQGMSLQQMAPYLINLCNTNPQTNGGDNGVFVQRCQMLLPQTNDPRISALLNLWIQSNYPVLSPDPQAIIAQATSGYSPMSPQFYQIAMAALQNVASQQGSIGFLFVARGSMLLQQTLQNQQVQQNQDYATIKAALSTGLSGTMNTLPTTFNRSVFQPIAQPYSPYPSSAYTQQLPYRGGNSYYTN